MASERNIIIIVLVVLGALALGGAVLYWYTKTNTSQPVVVSTFVFKRPVISHTLLPLRLASGAGATSVKIETPVALFLHDAKTLDVTKQIFQKFAETNASYIVCFEINRSKDESLPVLATLGLEFQSLPAVVFFTLGVIVDKTTNITEASLQSFVKKASFKTPIKQLNMSDFNSGGDLITAPDKGLVIINSSGPCGKCDALAPVFQSFAEKTPSCLVFYANAETSPGVDYLNAVKAPKTTDYPLLFPYDATKFQTSANLTVATVAGLRAFVKVASEVVFNTPVDNAVTALRWNAPLARFSSYDSTKPTLVLVYDSYTTDKARLSFQTFAEQHAGLANYETLDATKPDQYAFFATAGYPDPAPYPVIIKYDIGGLPSKQTSRDFFVDPNTISDLIAFNFTGVKSVAVENFLVSGTDTAALSYVGASPVCVFVYSDACECEAKKRIYQKVFDTVSNNLFFANSSDPATAPFFTDSKIDPNAVAIHKWLQGSGSHSPDPITSAFDLATVSAYVK